MEREKLDLPTVRKTHKKSRSDETFFIETDSDSSPPNAGESKRKTWGWSSLSRKSYLSGSNFNDHDMPARIQTMNKSDLKCLVDIPCDLQDETTGDNIFAIAMRNTNDDIIVKIMDSYIQKDGLGKDKLLEKNYADKSPVDISIDQDSEKLVEWILQKLPNDEDMRDIAVSAALKSKFNALSVISRQRPSLLDFTSDDGYAPVHILLRKILDDSDSEEQKSERSSLMTTFGFGKNEEILDLNSVFRLLMRQTSVKTILSMPDKFSILHELIFLNYDSDVKHLLKRIPAKDLDKIWITRDGGHKKTPMELLFAMKASTVQMFQILLDFRADPNTVKMSALKGIFHNENAQNPDTAKILQLILIKLNDTNFKSIIDYVDDEKLSFFMLRLIIPQLHARDLLTPEFVNEKRRHGCNVLHILMQSSSEDITENLLILLKSKIKICDTNSDGLTPIQTAFGSFGGYNQASKLVTRLKQYFSCLRSLSFVDLIEDHADSLEDLAKYHLTPAIYVNERAFVHELFNEIFHVSHNAEKTKILHSALHYSQENVNIYNKTPLYWVTYLSDDVLLHDIVRAEYEVHNAMKKAMPMMDCFNKLPATNANKLKAITMYKEFFEVKSLLPNLVSAFFIIGLSCYFLYGTDMYLDLNLMDSYSERAALLRNGSLNSTVPHEDPDHYDFAWYITLFTISISVGTYLFNTCCFYDPLPSITEVSTLPLRCLKMVARMFSPIIFILFFVWFKANQLYDPHSRQNLVNLQRCERIWFSIRGVETGFEAIAQLLIQLWLLEFFIDELPSTFWEVLSDAWQGIGNAFLHPHVEATFVQSMVGKMMLSCIFVCLSLTLLRTKANGPVLGLLIFFLACLCEMLARLMSIKLYFRMASDKSLYLIGFIGTHFLLELLIKILFELPPKKSLKTASQYFFIGFKTAASSVSSILVFMNLDKNREASETDNEAYKNTLIPISIHFIICLLEQIIIVVFWICHMKNPVDSFIYMPFVFLAMSGALLFFYYYWLHPSSVLTNGPKCICKKSTCQYEYLFCCVLRSCGPRSHSGEEDENEAGEKLLMSQTQL